MRRWPSTFRRAPKIVERTFPAKMRPAGAGCGPRTTYFVGCFVTLDAICGHWAPRVVGDGIRILIEKEAPVAKQGWPARALRSCKESTLSNAFCRRLRRHLGGPLVSASPHEAPRRDEVANPCEQSSRNFESVSQSSDDGEDGPRRSATGKFRKGIRVDTGRAWTMDLRLDRAPALRPSDAEIKAYLDDAALPLATLQPGKGTSDLAPLKKMIGDAHIPRPANRRRRDKASATFSLASRRTVPSGRRAPANRRGARHASTRVWFNGSRRSTSTRRSAIAGWRTPSMKSSRTSRKGPRSSSSPRTFMSEPSCGIWAKWGTVLRERHASDYFVIGTAFGSGAVNAYSPRPGAQGKRRVEVFALGPPPPASFDAALALTQKSLFAIDLRGISRRDAQWMTRPTQLAYLCHMRDALAAVREYTAGGPHSRCLIEILQHRPVRSCGGQLHTRYREPQISNRPIAAGCVPPPSMFVRDRVLGCGSR